MGLPLWYERVESDTPAAVKGPGTAHSRSAIRRRPVNNSRQETLQDRINHRVEAIRARAPRVSAVHAADGPAPDGPDRVYDQNFPAFPWIESGLPPPGPHPAANGHDPFPIVVQYQPASTGLPAPAEQGMAQRDEVSAPPDANDHDGARPRAENQSSSAVATWRRFRTLTARHPSENMSWWGIESRSRRPRIHPDILARFNRSPEPAESRERNGSGRAASRANDAVRTRARPAPSSLRRSRTAVPSSPRHVQTGANDRDDRGRTLSPEVDVDWRTLYTTMTPDPQPPSASASFTSTSVSASAAASAAASQTTAATRNSAELLVNSTERPDPNLAEPPCDSCEHSDVEDHYDEESLSVVNNDPDVREALRRDERLSDELSGTESITQAMLNAMDVPSIEEPTVRLFRMEEQRLRDQLRASRQRTRELIRARLGATRPRPSVTLSTEQLLPDGAADAEGTSRRAGRPTPPARRSRSLPADDGGDDDGTADEAGEADEADDRDRTSHRHRHQPAVPSPPLPNMWLQHIRREGSADEVVVTGNHTLGDGNATRPVTQAAATSSGEELAGLLRIVQSLARREDIPDEWWANAGLNRMLPRDPLWESDEE